MPNLNPVPPHHPISSTPSSNADLPLTPKKNIAGDETSEIAREVLSQNDIQRQGSELPEINATPIESKSWIGTVSGGLWGAGSSLIVAAKTAGKFLKDTTYATGTGAVRSYIGSYHAELDKETKIAISKQIMADETGSDQLSRLFEAVRAYAGETVKKKVPDFFKGPIADLLGDEAVIIDLIEINLAIGFENLAQNLALNYESIPNFDRQPMWLNVLIFLHKKAESTLDTKKLREIEQQYAQRFDELESFKNRVLPEYQRNDPLIEKLTKEYIECGNESKREKIFEELTARFLFNLPLQNADFTSKQLKLKLDPLIPLKDDLAELFGKSADVIVEQLFPNKINDMEVPRLLKIPGLTGLIYGFIKNMAQDAIYGLYTANKSGFMDGLAFIEIDTSQITSLSNVESEKEALMQTSGGSALLPNLAKALSSDVIKLFTDEKEKSPEGKTAEDRTVEKIEKALFAGASDMRMHLIDQLRDTENRSFFHSFIEGAVLRVFTIIAKANPGTPDKPTEVAVFEKAGVILSEVYKKIHGDADINALSSEFVNRCMSEVLGLTQQKIVDGRSVFVASDELSRLPAPVVALILKQIESLLNNYSSTYLKEVKMAVDALGSENPEVKRVKEALKKFDRKVGSTDPVETERSNAEIVISDLIQAVLPVAFGAVSKKSDGESLSSGVALALKQGGGIIENLFGKDSEMMKALKESGPTSPFVQMLEGAVSEAVDPENFREGKNEAAELGTNLLLSPVNELLDTATRLPVQKVMGNIFQAAGDHIRILNRAQRLARFNGRENISNQDFAAAAGRKKADRKEIPDAAGRALLHAAYPKGKESLTWVDAERRDQVWKMLETDLIPLVLSPAMNAALSPDMIKEVVLSSLESTVSSLNLKVDGKEPVPARSLTEGEQFLGQAAGGIIAETIGMLDLPSVVRNQLIDRTTGNVNPTLEQSVALALSDTFNSTFIENAIKDALAKFATHEPGKSNFDFSADLRSSDVAAAEKIEKRAITDKEIRRTTRKLIRAGISNFVRTSWANFQFRFDKAIETAITFTIKDKNVALLIKHCVDAVCRFVFFTVIGTVLKLCLWPMEKLTEECIYRFAKIDRNLDTIFGIFDRIPEDQPEGLEHAEYNEDLIYNVVNIVSEAIEEVSKSKGVSE